MPVQSSAVHPQFWRRMIVARLLTVVAVASDADEASTENG